MTVSEDLWKQLKERAEKEGLSLPQLVEQYMTHADSMNSVLWLEQSQAVKARIDDISSRFRGSIMEERVKKFAKEFRLKGESIPEIPYETRVQWENEAKEISLLLAEQVIEKDRETYNEFKRQEQLKSLPSLKKRKEDLENQASQLSKQISEIEGAVNG